MPQQNNVSQMRTQGIDLKIRKQEVLQDIISLTEFIPDEKQLRQSEWLTTGKVGAIHLPGVLEGKRTVLKIQGTKPSVSEAFMISSFNKQNKSKIIRPPKLYKHLDWNEDKQYEALFLEEVKGECVITGHPSQEVQLNEFFDLYKEYRANCLTSAWIEKPKQFSYRDIFANWREAIKDKFDIDRFKEEGDEKLISQGIEILEKTFTVDDLEFMHGHFQPGDLIKTQNGEVILFSNLFWSWRIPFYDAVFAYHWWTLGMEHAENLNEALWREEQKKWLQNIYALPNVKGREKQLILALLERVVAALTVDRFMMDQEKSSAELITKLKREELQSLLRELS